MAEDSRKTLAFRSLVIQRLLGMTAEDNLRYTDESAFCDGINVIIGANATGKSTTAAALKAMLWPPRRSDQIDLAAAIEIGGLGRTGELSGNDITWTDPGTGEKTDSPRVPDEAFSQCYDLALEELLAGKAKALTERIEISVNGGYDLAAARKALKFSGKVSGLSGLPKKLTAYERAVGEAVNAQSEFEHDERTLGEKEVAATKADAAKEKADAVDCLLNYRNALSEAANFRERHAEFPGGIFKMRKEDPVDLKSAVVQQETADKKLAELRDEMHGLKTIDLPETPIEEADLGRLQDRITNTLKEAERASIDRQTDATIAATAAGAARDHIGRGISDDQLAALLTTDDLPKDLRDSATKWQTADSQHSEAQRRVNALETDAEESQERHPEETLNEGIGELRRWLRQPRSTTAAKKSYAAFVAAIVAAVLAVIAAAVLSHPLPLALVVALVVVTALTWPRESTGAVHSSATVLAECQNVYAATGLPAPETWEPNAVDECLRHLQNELDFARLAKKTDEQRADHLRTAEQECTERQQDLTTCNKQMEEIRCAWGLTEAVSPEGLRSLVDRLAGWRVCALEAEKTAAAQREAEEAFEKHLAAVEKLIRVFMPSAAIDGWRTAQTQYEELVAAWKQQQRLEELNQKEIPRLENDLAQATQAIVGIAERLELADKSADELGPTLQEWRNALQPDATEAEKNLTAAEFRCRAAETVKSALAPALREMFDGLDVDQLRQGRQELTEEAGTLGALREEIGGLRTKINKARSGARIEEAQWQLQVAREEVGTRCRTEAANLIGSLCADFVRERCETQGSEVLVQAGKYLGAFTRDCHSQLIPAPGLGFKVNDDRRGPLVPEQLSSATRVQLLIAARLAFLDDLEKDTGVRLPLLLDEILCNSDDDRTSAVIHAIADIAADGRQVFYFTAQHDEAGKWGGFDDERLPCTLKIIALPIGHDPPPPIAIARPDRADVPEPVDGEGWEVYLTRIAPAPFEPFTATPTLCELHLVYVIRNVPSLYRLLVNGYSTWGQLQRLRERGGIEAVAEFIGDDADKLFARASARQGCLKMLLAEWRLGRGAPVDVVDIDSGGKVFIAQAHQLAKISNFDGEKMMDEAAAVDGWGRGAIDKLRTILTEANALPEEAERASRRTAEELRVSFDAHLNTVVSEDLRDLLRRDRHVMLLWFPTEAGQ
jgi:hypothetical protein